MRLNLNACLALNNVTLNFTLTDEPFNTFKMTKSHSVVNRSQTTIITNSHWLSFSWKVLEFSQIVGNDSLNGTSKRILSCLIKVHVYWRAEFIGKTPFKCLHWIELKQFWILELEFRTSNLLYFVKLYLQCFGKSI